MSGIHFKIVQCWEGVQMKQDSPYVEIIETEWWMLDMGREVHYIITFIFCTCFKIYVMRSKARND